MREMVYRHERIREASRGRNEEGGKPVKQWRKMTTNIILLIGLTLKLIYLKVLLMIQRSKVTKPSKTYLMTRYSDMISRSKTALMRISSLFNTAGKNTESISRQNSTGKPTKN